MYEEVIEATIVSFKENEIPLIPEDITMDVLDNLVSKGEVTHEQVDQGIIVEQITAQVRHYLTPAELAAARPDRNTAHPNHAS